MSHRVLQLQARRRELLLQSERLRDELAADQRVMADAFSGIERTFEIARRLATPALVAVGGAFLLRLLRRRRIRPTAAAAGFAGRSLAWLSLARRLLSLLTVVRAVAAARRRRQTESQF